MAQNIKIIVYPVSDREKAVKFFNKFLETEPYVNDSYYVGYKTGDIEVGLDPNSKLGPISYIDVEDIKASLKELGEVGAKTIQEPKEVGGGLLIARVQDVDGNVLGLRQETL
jgi:predicted enzyme related to lactoylglutathione lyase